MNVPTASRPRFHDYGISDRPDGMLDWQWALERLGASRNYWISTTRDDGRPHAMPVWGVVVDGELWFGTKPDSVKGRNLERTGQLVAHTESGDETVILEGTGDIREVPPTVLDAYEAKYGLRLQIEHLYAVAPNRAFAWREEDYPVSATRFDF